VYLSKRKIVHNQIFGSYYQRVPYAGMLLSRTKLPTLAIHYKKKLSSLLLPLLVSFYHLSILEQPIAYQNHVKKIA
jgi:hypothetical protein